MRRVHLVSLGLLGAAVFSAGACEVFQTPSRDREPTPSIEPTEPSAWSEVVSLSLVPVAAANLPDGKVLFWAAESRFAFGIDLGRTYTVVFDPSTGASSERLVSETNHDMFCPGTANLPDGRLLVNGGLSSGATSIFEPTTGTWTRAADMNIPRAYQGTAALADGTVFTLGGSFSGGVGNKHGELWSEAGGWRLLPGVPVDPFLSVDTSRSFGADGHFWLIPAGNGRLLHAGPGVNMHWIDTRGDGSVELIGPRADDAFSISGGVVMFDTGKILKAGGAPGYDGFAASAASYVIEVGTDVTVRKIQPMAFRRSFHNLVVLPTGQVVAVGGMTRAEQFSDDNSVLAPELFDPVSETFSVLSPLSVPRNYHSVALLLPDGRVLAAGGGLCGDGCAANHPDLQILSPPYLFDASGAPARRPVIQSAPSHVVHGAKMRVTTDSPIASFAIVRNSSVTHSVNNDQRRLALAFTVLEDGSYEVEIPSNPGWAVPGMYMLFAIDEKGVPSVASQLRVGADRPLWLSSPGNQSTSLGDSVELVLDATSPDGAALTFSARGLPFGLALEPETGRIHGVPDEAGRYLVEVSVSDGAQTTSTELTWSVTETAP